MRFSLLSQDIVQEQEAKSLATILQSASETTEAGDSTQRSLPNPLGGNREKNNHNGF